MLSPEEAASALAQASEARLRGRRAATAMVRASLIWWGVDWLIGYALFQFWPGWPVAAGWSLLSLALYALPRLYVAEAGLVRSGWEDQFRRSWWVMLAGSLACICIVAPTTITVYLLLLGAVWGIAYALYGVIVGDRETAWLGTAILVLAVALRLVAHPWALLAFGMTGGGSMILLGVIRLRRGL